MRKLLNNRWFVAALATVAIALVWSSLESSTTSARRFSTDETALASTDEALPSGPALPSPQEALAQLSSPKNPRDPFAALATTEAAPVAEKTEQDFVDTAHLSGIWSQNGATLLLVNEQIRSIGDTIGRLTIESATPQGVWLTHWKGRTFLALGKTFSLKTPVRLPGQIFNP